MRYGESGFRGISAAKLFREGRLVAIIRLRATTAQIAIDGSGSLRTTGFDIISDVAAELIDRYKSKYFDNAAIQIGVVLFGNGAVLADGTVSGPTRVAKITDDLASVKTKIVVASQVY